MGNDSDRKAPPRHRQDVDTFDNPCPICRAPIKTDGLTLDVADHAFLAECRAEKVRIRDVDILMAKAYCAHRCPENVLRAIDAAHGRDIDDEVPRRDPGLDDRLALGFYLMNNNG